MPGFWSKKPCGVSGQNRLAVTQPRAEVVRVPNGRPNSPSAPAQHATDRPEPDGSRPPAHTPQSTHGLSLPRPAGPAPAQRPVAATGASPECGGSVQCSVVVRLSAWLASSLLPGHGRTVAPSTAAGRVYIGTTDFNSKKPCGVLAWICSPLVAALTNIGSAVNDRRKPAANPAKVQKTVRGQRAESPSPLSARSGDASRDERSTEPAPQAGRNRCLRRGMRPSVVAACLPVAGRRSLCVALYTLMLGWLAACCLSGVACGQDLPQGRLSARDNLTGESNADRQTRAGGAVCQGLQWAQKNATGYGRGVAGSWPSIDRLRPQNSRRNRHARGKFLDCPLVNGRRAPQVFQLSACFFLGIDHGAALSAVGRESVFAEILNCGRIAQGDASRGENESWHCGISSEGTATARESIPDDLPGMEARTVSAVVVATARAAAEPHFALPVFREVVAAVAAFQHQSAIGYALAELPLDPLGGMFSDCQSAALVDPIVNPAPDVGQDEFASDGIPAPVRKLRSWFGDFDLSPCVDVFAQCDLVAGWQSDQANDSRLLLRDIANASAWRGDSGHCQDSFSLQGWGFDIADRTLARPVCTSLRGLPLPDDRLTGRTDHQQAVRPGEPELPPVEIGRGRLPGRSGFQGSQADERQSDHDLVSSEAVGDCGRIALRCCRRAERQQALAASEPLGTDHNAPCAAVVQRRPAVGVGVVDSRLTAERGPVRALSRQVRSNITRHDLHGPRAPGTAGSTRCTPLVQGEGLSCRQVSGVGQAQRHCRDSLDGDGDCDVPLPLQVYPISIDGIPTIGSVYRQHRPQVCTLDGQAQPPYQQATWKFREEFSTVQAGHPWRLNLAATSDVARGEADDRESESTSDITVVLNLRR